MVLSGWLCGSSCGCDYDCDRGYCCDDVDDGYGSGRDEVEGESGMRTGCLGAGRED
jgi:hypothetical protein